MFNIADIVTAASALNENPSGKVNDETATGVTNPIKLPATRERRSRPNKGALSPELIPSAASALGAGSAPPLKGSEPAVTLLPPPTKKITKAETIIALLRQGVGASVPEIMVTTGWRAHSVRGFLSGTVRKKLGHDLKRATDEGGIRRYRLDPVAHPDDGPCVTQSVLGDLAGVDGAASGATDTTSADERN